MQCPQGLQELLSFAYFALGAHLLDAARHYWHDEGSFSFALNLVWGIVAVLIGFALLN